jgi:hypothetical protein
MSNPFYARHTFHKARRAFKHRQMMFTDTTGFMTWLAGFFAITSVKVIIFRQTTNMP